MEKSIFSYIWKYSKYDQVKLLLVTLIAFPVMYVSLELPKRIINDAIGGTGEDVVVLGLRFTQIEFLMLLCFTFLIAVITSGLIKMVLNTMRGVVAERLLRRVRYQMLTRLLRFPQPYFRRTSQGELVSMITSEVEPMSGLMGDFLSQPVFQAGQMLTILTFLFAQSFWFGLASVALIPVQALLIPMLQRRINLLNKARIQEIRHFATDIGEAAGGVGDLRVNGGTRHKLAQYSQRLGVLFQIRLEIFKKKYFMKFLNNLLNQLTPFFFYSVGGYLAIQGEITVGALVAALAAYKDIASPWKELLTYYNQTQDMAVRWEVLTERFQTSPLVHEGLFEGRAARIPRLNGDIELRNVTVIDEDGRPVLEDISCVIPGGARIAIKSNSDNAAIAFAELLAREVTPYSGRVLIDGMDLNELHQDVIATRIGYANSNPHFFQGTLRENMLMPFRNGTPRVKDLSPEQRKWQIEATRSGNSIEPPELDWVDPHIGGFETLDAVHDWWFQLVQAMDLDDMLVRRALLRRIDPAQMPALAEALVRLRPEIAARIRARGLDDVVHRFDPELFNPVAPLASNLLYALPRQMLSQLSLSRSANFLRVLRDQGIMDDLAEISANVLLELRATFGVDATEHPLFRRLNLDTDLYLRLTDIAARWKAEGTEALPSEDFALMLTVPFAFSAEDMGSGFDDTLRQKILDIRKRDAESMVAQMDGLFVPISPDRYFPVMSLLGNAIFGRVSKTAGARETEVLDVVIEVLKEHHLRRSVAQAILDVEVSAGGESLRAVNRERVAFTRAGIKKPDILILRNVLASHSRDEREKSRNRISELLPQSTKIFIERKFYRPEQYDLFLEIVDGRIDGQLVEEAPTDPRERESLERKLRILSKTALFGELELKQRKLLAFSSVWFKVKAGQRIFHAGQEADAAYLCLAGRAAVYWPGDHGKAQPITDVEPGRLIGDLNIILGMKRTMDFYAEEDSIFLRIGAEEFMSVIENDTKVATDMLRKVSRNLVSASAHGRAVHEFAVAHGVDYSEFDSPV
ncbi:ABC transporter transmembrane domain-containing protein [Pseudooceanicola nanhaiensis]|uniref:ABC transporter transmembrane domain-containing protein n=1 Tax=Pseudooceanicola nanhaiensis TaxID=375761 RepID=UPI001CD32DF1|nr:ABC transporter transmembrane domain-containing protein [Pseudooceanicola nanhaiensis]MCA0919297.1 cyclic nucleotide-binding domain-containing protein [Pseudooceanicola nanhaiensis]